MRSPDDGLRVGRGHWAGQEELWAQQGLVGAQAGQAGVELLPNLADPQHRALRSAIWWPISTSHLLGGGHSRRLMRAVGWIWEQTSSDLMEQLPAEVPSQQAVQRLLVPAEGHPAKVLLEAEL